MNTTRSSFLWFFSIVCLTHPLLARAQTAELPSRIYLVQYSDYSGLDQTVPGEPCYPGEICGEYSWTRAMYWTRA